MQITLLSHPISEHTTVPVGARQPRFEREKCKANGDSCETNWVAFSNHSSTHIDSPSHFISGGKTLTDFMPDDWHFDHVTLVDWLPDAAGLLKAERLESLSPGDLAATDLLLIRTGAEQRRSERWYADEGPGIHPDLARELAACMPNLRAVGLDAISVSPFQHRELGRETHRILLSHEIILIEDMRLSTLASAPDKVIAAPLLLESLGGAPATVFAYHLTGEESFVGSELKSS